MASRDRPSEGFLSVLNVISPTDGDFVEPKKKNKSRKNTNTYWEVERLVDRRERNGTVSMLGATWTAC